MSQSSFSLSWESHKNNICNGLTHLQQSGEFVDMTLAADGHHVKVHQMILALSSPYIKELIKSAACPHPVIVLNKISYLTLTALLEYIYTGEVLVSTEHLSELVEAARELHIKGLQDMDITQASNKMSSQQGSVAGEEMEELDDEICYFEVTPVTKDISSQKKKITLLDECIPEDSESYHVEMEENEETAQEETEEPAGKEHRTVAWEPSPISNANIPSVTQYTVSNQGSLQMILNRYMYYLKHCNRNKSRQWRCVDYLNQTKCPAIVFTKDDVVTKRISAHTHPFHDKRILKKVHANAVYTALQDAERQGTDIKNKSKENKD